MNLSLGIKIGIKEMVTGHTLLERTKIFKCFPFMRFKGKFKTDLISFSLCCNSFINLH